MEWACIACGGANPEGTKFCGHCGAPLSSPSASGGPETRRTASEADVSEALKSFVSRQVADHLVASGGEITEERRLVTALFADLSGFTPLADRLDPEELLEVIDPIIQRLTNIVGKYEGYVDKFAGDALLAFFGAPIAHEDDAHRALCVAMEMHEEIKNIKPDLPPDAGDLTLHIGVNSGRVVARVLGSDVRMDYSVLGDAVILAQRLESAAPAGETYVGQTTHLLTSDAFVFQPVGELTLKGKADPVVAYRLTGRKRRREQEATGFVGREQELQTINAILSSLAQGSGSVVSVSGEPGVGKSRFTQEVKDRAEEQGAQWLVTRCLSYGQGIAYWPVADLFRRLAGINYNDPPDRAAPLLVTALESASLGHSTPVLARLLGLPAPEVEALEPEAFRRLLHETIIKALTHIATRAPVVLVVEDLHWADASSVALISDLAGVCSTDPVLLYLTARTEALGVLVQIATGTQETLRHPIQLDPMDAPMTGPLIEGLLGGVGSPELVNVINERAVGNPFFVRELVRSLQDAGDITRSNGTWDLSEDFDASHVPPTIEGVLSARIDRLPRPLATTLQVSSVIGRRVQVPLLAAVHTNRNLESHLEGLVAAGLLEPSTDDEKELVFHHALVQDVAYSRLLRKRRRELHLRVAEEAERMYGAADDSIDLLARHLHLADAGAKAVDYLVRAAYRAADLFANDEAVIHLQHALELSEKHAPDRQGSILLKIADLHELRGEYVNALTRFTEARDLTDHVLAWRGIARAHRNLGDYDEAIAVVDEGLRASQGAESAQLWLEKGWVFSRQGRFAEAIEALGEGLTAAGASYDSVVGHLRVQLARAEMVTGTTDAALEHAESAVQIFEQLDDHRGWTTALRILGNLYRTFGKLDDAATTLRRGLDIARDTGNAEEQAGLHINLGLVELDRHELDLAIEHDHAAIDQFARIGIPTGQAIGYGNLTEKLMHAGRHTEALEASARALELARSIGDMETVADVTKTVAAVRLAQGNAPDAAASAEEAAELYLQMEARAYAVEALGLAAKAWMEAGEEERALSVTERARNLA